MRGAARRRTPARWHAAGGTCPAMPAPGPPATVTAAVAAVAAADDTAAAAAAAGSGVVLAAAVGAGSGTVDSQGPAGYCSRGHVQRRVWHGLPSHSPTVLIQSGVGTPVTQPQIIQILPLEMSMLHYDVRPHGTSDAGKKSRSFGPSCTKEAVLFAFLKSKQVSQIRFPSQISLPSQISASCRCPIMRTVLRQVPHKRHLHEGEEGNGGATLPVEEHWQRIGLRLCEGTGVTVAIT